MGLDSFHRPQDVLTLPLTAPPLSPDTHQTLTYLHQLLHPNSKALSYFVKTDLQPAPEVLSFLKSITASCKFCQISDFKSKYHSTPFPTHQARGFCPGMDWHLDFPTCPLFLSCEVYPPWMLSVQPLAPTASIHETVSFSYCMHQL